MPKTPDIPMMTCVPFNRNIYVCLHYKIFIGVIIFSGSRTATREEERRGQPPGATRHGGRAAWANFIETCFYFVNLTTYLGIET